METLLTPVHRIENVTQAKTYTNEYLKAAKATLRENALSVANLTLDNSDWIIYEFTTGDIIKLYVGEDTSHLDCIFYGKLRFPIAQITGEQNTAVLSLVHYGYCLADMLVGREYGAQSTLPSLDTIKKIITDANDGIIPRYVDKILDSDTPSGYSLNCNNVDVIADVINYVDFPFKPADKAIDDLVDVVTALKAGGSGCHWMVDNAGYFRLKLLGTSQVGIAGATNWNLWYQGTTNTAGQATLTLSESVKQLDYEEQQAEGNYILYYGNFRRPSSGDAWTQSHTGWDCSADITLSTDSGIYAVGTASVKALRNALGTPLRWWYPTAQTASWDFTSFGSTQYIPTLDFMAYRSGLTSLTVYLYTDGAHASRVSLYNSIGGPSMDGDDWISFSIPIGANWKLLSGNTWRWVNEAADPVTWSNVNWIEFGLTGLVDEYALIDGLNFGHVPLCRVAWNSNLPQNCQMRLITDNVGKSDSLVASDDSGVMAQLCYAELLRQQKATYHQNIQLPMLPKALPGQQFSLATVAYRATEIIHDIAGDDYTTTLKLNSDLINGRTRLRYEDVNKIYGNLRPEFQDRQAASIKAGSVDWRVQRLVKDYA